jgi:lipopolysaccharide/colanic/teichoic acid biosynthesis glycosyltransferase
MYKRFFKRYIDFIIAFVALVIIGWFILLVAIMLHFANKGAGAFFLQERPGKDGKPFKVIKFKTMTDERGADGELLPDVQRITKIGKLVRSLSIDELPQLINVLKGDMSLIGPRPLLMHYLPWYTPEQARRHEVRPGITGWAQVNGRNHCKLSKKFELDVWYVDHCTLTTDFKICKMTILNIIKREDVGEGTGNMEEVDDLGFHQRYLELLEQRKKND